MISSCPGYSYRNFTAHRNGDESLSPVLLPHLDVNLRIFIFNITKFCSYSARGFLEQQGVKVIDLSVVSPIQAGQAMLGA